MLSSQPQTLPSSFSCTPLEPRAGRAPPSGDEKGSWGRLPSGLSGARGPTSRMKPLPARTPAAPLSNVPRFHRAQRGAGSYARGPEVAARPFLLQTQTRGESPPRFMQTPELRSRGDGSPSSPRQAEGPVPCSPASPVATPCTSDTVAVTRPQPLTSPRVGAGPGRCVKPPPRPRFREPLYPVTGSWEFAEQKTYSRALGRTCISVLH